MIAVILASRKSPPISVDSPVVAAGGLCNEEQEECKDVCVILHHNTCPSLTLPYLEAFPVTLLTLIGFLFQKLTKSPHQLYVSAESCGKELYVFPLHGVENHIFMC